MRCAVFGCLLLAGVATSAAATPLAPLLVAVTRNARAQTPVRADLTIVRGGQTSTAVLLGWRNTWYLETAGGFRALARANKQVVLQKNHPVRAPIRTQVPGSDLLLEEIAFDGARLAFPQVNDESPEGVVVAGESATKSLYVLLVRTIDPERNIVTDSKYFKDDIGTLTKIRHDDRFVQVDGHWRPQSISIEDYWEKSTTTITLQWKVVPEMPIAVFAPSSLRRPSGIALPAPQ